MNNKHRFLSLAITAAITLATFAACEKGDPLEGVSGEGDKYGQSTDPSIVEVVSFSGEYELEDGILSGNAAVESSHAGFSGKGYVGNFTGNNDKVEITINFEESGKYDITFVTSSKNEHKENPAYIDNKLIGTLITNDDGTWQEYTLKGIYVEEGERVLSVKRGWGWAYFDKVTVAPGEGIDRGIYEVSSTLVNSNADKNARRLMKFLTDVYGDYIISGQYSGATKVSSEFTNIYEITGRYPAMAGFDLMEYTPSRVEFGSGSSDVDNAIRWWEQDGGIVTFCWHWNAPTKYLINTPSNPWWRGFYADATNIDLAKIMNGEDEEGYNLLISDIDAIAVQLKVLEDAGVPVLWRPLHEASGGWFWWGAAGAEPLVELWQLMYDRLTNHHKINNLIWVWNGQDGPWYPGDEYVDIIGEDVYGGAREYSSKLDRFNKAVDYTDTKKIIAMTENDTLFDPDLAIRDGNMWAWFGTWVGEFVVDEKEYSEEYTEKSMLDRVYNHARVITLDELPDLKKYPLK